jgi:hypothetical protein
MSNLPAAPFRFHRRIPLLACLALLPPCAPAGTIIRANSPGANGMGAQNSAIPASFGDNISLPIPGNAVFQTYAGSQGIVGTPAIDLTWSANGGTNANRWEFHSWSAATTANAGGGALQMDGSAIGSRFSITFTPQNTVGVLLSSFHFVGDTNGDTYQYRVEIIDLSDASVVHSHETPLWTTQTSQNPSTNGTRAGAPAVNLGFSGQTGRAYRLDITRIGGSGASSAVNIAIDDLDFDQTAPPDPGLPPAVSIQATTTASLVAGVEQAHTVRATDPEGFDVSMQIDWGDGRFSAWSAPQASGSNIVFPHAYPHGGTFPIRARARDALGATSDWVALQIQTVAPAPGRRDGLAGWWEFDDPSALGAARFGNDLQIVGTPPTHSASLADGSAEPLTLHGVITTLAGPANHLNALHAIGANGLGTNTNRYTLVFDFLAPPGTQWRSFYQASLANNNDAEYFLRNTNNTLGRTTIGYSTATVTPNRWHRLALSVDLSSGGFYRTYLDGILLHSHTKPAADGEYSLDPSRLLFFADNDNENQPLVIGMAAIFNKALDAAEILAIGSPGLSLALPENNTPPLASPSYAGPASVETGQSARFEFSATDPQGHDVQIQADWGDGSLSSWSNFTPSGQPVALRQTWSFPGNREIRIRARDRHGETSDWLALGSVEITGTPQLTFATQPYLQNLSESTMVVMAETVETFPLVLQYGSSPALGSQVPMESVASGGGTHFLRGVLTGLPAGTLHHYRLATAAGDVVHPGGTFRTAPADWEDFTLGAIGDIQTTNGGVWAADPWEPAKVMLQHMLTRGVSFGLGLGDHAQDGNAYATTRSSHLDRMCAVLGRHVPFYISWGNHDGSSPSHPLRLSADMPSRWQSGESPSTRTPGYGNYTFTHAGVYFVCLEYFETNNRAADAANNDITNGWLDAKLSSPEARDARFRILAIHVPPYCERWINGNATLRAQLVPRLSQHKVDLVLSGHMHGYERGRIHGVQYVISGAGSYLDFTEPLVANWSASTDDGLWLGGHQSVPGSYARQSANGVLGPPQPINGGLFHGYSQITVRDRYLRLDQHGFNADGSYIGILDTIEMGSPDPGPDSDGDGMRDAWEIAHHLDPQNPADALFDYDGDGQSNLAESLAGTDPNNPASSFRVANTITGPDSLRVTWTSVPGRRYRLWTSQDLRSWDVFAPSSGSPQIITATTSETSLELPWNPVEKGFVRVEVMR